MEKSFDMHQAVMAGGLEYVQKVFEHDATSVNQANELGFSPLYTAALYRNEAAVDFLLEHGAKLDIFATAWLGRSSDAKALLADNPALVDAMANDGMTPLHCAARSGSYEVASLLVDHEANVNAMDKNGGTPLLEACHGGPWKPAADERIVTLLLDRGAQVDLHSAAALGRTDLLEMALAANRGAINGLNSQGQSALFLAAKNNRLQAVKWLVSRGADVNLGDVVGIAALHRTSRECSDELIQFLVDSGAEAHLCCFVACGDAVGTERALRARPESATELLYELHPVGYAIHSWQMEPLRILLRYGCKLTSEDRQHILRISGGDQSLLEQLLSIESGESPG